MAANDIPSELATSCLARLGLPLLIFDSGEVLIHCNIAASRTIPACRNSSVDTGGETSLHAKDLFSHSAIDTFDFATAGIISTAPVSAFSLARLVADHATKDATTGEEEDSLDSAGFPKSTGWGDDSLQGAECQAYLNIKSGREGRKAYWWQASISSFFGADERSHYFSVTLIQEIATPVARPIIPPEPNSQPSSLERPPLTRRASEKDAQAVTLDDVVPESGEASSLDMDFYKTAVESMSEILFVSAVSGVVTYLKYASTSCRSPRLIKSGHRSNQWYKYVGWDPDDPDNRNRWAEVFHPDDVQLAVEAYGASVRSGDDIRLQYRVRRADGVFRWMIARGRPVRDHSGQIASFVSTLTDAEDLINARHEAVQARQHISTVLRAAAITLIVVDSSTQILMVDGYEMVRASLGLAATGNPAGQRLDQFWPDENCVEQVREILARWEAATNVSTSKSIAERDFMTQVGEHHLRYRVSPLYHSDNSAEAPQAKNIAGLAIVCTDVTAMVQAELALQESQRQREALAVSEEAAKEASRLKTVFVTSLSHEIRTPVASMLGISELLLADALSEKQRSLVAKQIQAGELLLSLVSMVLDIGKMEANKLEVELRPFFLADLLSDMDIFTSLAEAKGLYFRTAIHGDYAHALLGDRLRLAQVLFNFLNNAIKFTRKGGITLQVSVTSEASKCLVTCKVIDTGIGIASDTLPQLFKPFHQASVSTAREYGGSGLGLAIAKQVKSSHRVL